MAQKEIMSKDFNRLNKSSLKEIPMDRKDVADTYLLEKLKKSNDFLHRSFSYRYMLSKKEASVIKSLTKLLEKSEKKSSVKILDIGCNEGYLIFQLRMLSGEKYNLDFTGIDLSPQAIDFANRRKEFFKTKNCQFKVMDANNLQYEERQFDVVICSEVIEHIEEPVKVLKEIYRVLRESGLVIVTTPNKGGGAIAKLARFINYIAFNTIRIRRERKRNIYQGRRILRDDVGRTAGGGVGFGHISVNGHQEWARIIKQAGFRIQRKAGTGGMLFGDILLDEHRVLFASLVILDTLLERFPYSYLWSEILLFELRRK